MSVKPATRRVRSAIVVREREVSLLGSRRALRTDFQYMGVWVPVCREKGPWWRLLGVGEEEQVLRTMT